MNRFQYGYEITGRKIKTGPGAGKVWWRRGCKRIVANQGDRCWQHRGPAAEHTQVIVVVDCPREPY